VKDKNEKNNRGGDGGNSLRGETTGKSPDSKTRQQENKYLS